MKRHLTRLFDQLATQLGAGPTGAGYRVTKILCCTASHAFDPATGRGAAEGHHKRLIQEKRIAFCYGYRQQTQTHGQLEKAVDVGLAVMMLRWSFQYPQSALMLVANDGDYYHVLRDRRQAGIEMLWAHLPHQQNPYLTAACTRAVPISWTLIHANPLN